MRSSGVKKLVLVLMAAVITAVGVSAEVFEFQYYEGSKYRILSQVNEDVFINGVYSHTADILNKISVHISQVDDGSGFLEADFITFERSAGSGGVYQWGQDYTSKFWRDRTGHYDIEPVYYMPVVRNVPLFPGRDIQLGEKWVGEGNEVHDFRTNFGIPEPYEIPITVNYQYIGKEEKDGRVFDLITIDYNVYFRAGNRYPRLTSYPVRITGVSEQLLYWDSEYGRPYAYEEQFEFLFILSNGATVEYRGAAEALVIQSESFNRAEVAEDISNTLKEADIQDVEVRIVDEGVTISLENIQFLPDSAVLLEQEKVKIEKIAEILKKYPDRDIMITGHTALAGTEQGRELLSELRAATVGDYLLKLGAKEPEQITTRGMGARVPLGDNRTERGKRKNRRVEITILEN